MKLKSIDIHNFRHMNNLSIEFGDVFTVISGLNGCGKSSILGMIAHVFNSNDKSLVGKNMTSTYSEVFKFCSKKDYNSEYSYVVDVEDESGAVISKRANSRYSETEKNRYRIDVGERSSKGTGKLIHPVIFLGLSRLLPMASMLGDKQSSIVETNVSISAELEKDYSKIVKNVFTLTSGEAISSEEVKTKQKIFRGISTEKYSALGASAGQDNLGQIITSLLSFKNLKLLNQDEYKGGILLIDEIDSTLFPAARKNLIKQLYSYAKSLNLQIIFTTHAMDILELLEENYQEDTRTYFFENVGASVRVKQNPDNDYIKAKINMVAGGFNNNPKPNVKVLVEDKMGKELLNKLLNGEEIKRKYNIKIEITNGDGVIKTLANNVPKALKDFVLLPDGDMKKKIKEGNNVVFLPGHSAPETFLYKFLFLLPEEHVFWENASLFDKNACFNGYVDKDTEKDHKKWVSAVKNQLNNSQFTFNNFLSASIKLWKLECKSDRCNFLSAFDNACMYSGKYY